MAITLLASQCPVPVVETAYPLLASSENSTGTSTYNRVSRSFAAGDTATVPAKLNRNANALDQAFNFGGGAFAILTGIAISIGSGLNVAVSAGLAAIGGPVEVTAQNLPVAANHTGSPVADRVWLWLTQAGALTTTLSTTPPATRCICIGSCTTDASSVTSVDTSGVMTMKGGSPWRETADIGAPTDSPSATLSFFAKTWGGVFEWTGAAYKALYQPLSPNRKTLGSGESATIKDDEQVVLYGAMNLTGTGELVIEGTGELIAL